MTNIKTYVLFAFMAIATIGIALGTATTHIANAASCTGKPSPGNSHNDGGNAHSTGESDKCPGSK